MNKDQQDAIYAAYLGICVLRTMCRKSGLVLGEQRANELLVELGTAFPFIPERVGLSALRGGGTRLTAKHPLAQAALKEDMPLA